MERCGLEVLDVENLRRHYALTLDAWAERFDRNWDGDPRARSRALRRALPADLAHIPAGRARRCSARTSARRISSRSRSARATSARSYPMSRAFLYRRCSVTALRREARGVCGRARRRAPPGAPRLGLAKGTSNLFRDRARRRRRASTLGSSITCSASTRRQRSSTPRAWSRYVDLSMPRLRTA